MALNVILDCDTVHSQYTMVIFPQIHLFTIDTL